MLQKNAVVIQSVFRKFGTNTIPYKAGLYIIAQIKQKSVPIAICYKRWTRGTGRFCLGFPSTIGGVRAAGFMDVSFWRYAISVVMGTARLLLKVSWKPGSHGQQSFPAPISDTAPSPPHQKREKGGGSAVIDSRSVCLAALDHFTYGARIAQENVKNRVQNLVCALIVGRGLW